MRAQLHEVVQLVGPNAAQPLTPRSDHLRATTAQSAHRRAPAASSRPKSMVTAREDRVEDGLPTVVLAHVVDLVGIRDGVVTPSRSSGGGYLGRVVGLGAVPALPSLVPCETPTVSPMSMKPWRAHTQGGTSPLATACRKG